MLVTPMAEIKSSRRRGHCRLGPSLFKAAQSLRNAEFAVVERFFLGLRLGSRKAHVMSKEALDEQKSGASCMQSSSKII